MTRDQSPEQPAWLKAVQNGTLGEARARAFLLERFWVLERSADVHGADLIIQRRLTTKNLLDRDAPRLGVVQVKFFGTPTTTHFVHREYALNERGEPREEFFLLCCTGTEEEVRMYLVPGRDLHDAFEVGNRDGSNGFIIPLSKLRADRRFEVINAKRTLDRIEHQLEVAEFTKNRQFLSWVLPSASDELGAIEPIYREPIDNWWGDIPEGFEKIKKAARWAMIRVEEIHELFLQLTQQTDPLAAADIVDDIAYNCRGGDGSWGIGLSSGFYDSDFFQACRRHRRMVDRLTADGLLDAFLAMKEKLRSEIATFLEDRLTLGRDELHLFTLTYDPESLVVTSIVSTMEDRPEAEGSQVVGKWSSTDHKNLRLTEPGRIIYSWFPGRQHRPPEAGSAAEWLRRTDFFMYYECLDAVFVLKYGEATA